jgi:hypothetical protein
VPNQQDGILVGILFQQLLEIREAGFGAQRAFGYKPAFVTHLISDESGRLRGSLERTRDNDVDLHIKRRQSAPYVTALLDAIFIEGALFVTLGAAQPSLPGTGVA